MEVKETDKPKRLDFTLIVLAQIWLKEAWLDKIFQTDEANLHLNGSVNAQL